MVTLESPADHTGRGFFLTACRPSDPLDHSLFQTSSQMHSMLYRPSSADGPVQSLMTALTCCDVTVVGDL